MRIVLLIPIGIDRPSGRRYFHLARGLVRLGHRVRILALHADLAAGGPRRFVQDGVEIWYVGQMHARKQGSATLRLRPWALLRVLIAATWGMIQGVLHSPAEVYHLGKPQPVNGLAALIAICLLRRQQFYVDCDDDERYSNRFTARWQRALFGAWQWLLPRLAQGVTVNSRELAVQIVPPGKPTVYVPNGVDLAALVAPDEARRSALRRALGLEGTRVIVYVGTLALHNHPVDLLLAAFARLAPDWPTARLLLVGGGEDLPKLQAWVVAHGLAAQVLFTGQVAHRFVAELLAQAELSVDPVYDDPVARARSPLKLFESLALGVPVVTGAVGDRPQWLDQGRAGLLVAPGDVAALADGLAALLADPARAAAMGAAGRAHVVRYDWDRLAAQWATIYGAPAPTRPAPTPQGHA
jgi:glycosyltransferase involved in cell wall biosynthesis